MSGIFSLNPITGRLDETGGGGPGGDVIGPVGAVNNNIATFDGTSGLAIKDSGVPITSVVNKFGAINIQRFTSSGTYVPTAGMKYCIIECVGGGGGGGGVQATAAGQVGAGGGGGSGAFSTVVATAANIGASRPVTVGAGGSGGPVGSNGGAGSTTGVTSICTAAGGGGGSVGVAGSASNGPGGTAGNGGTGLLSLGEGGAQGIGSFSAGFIIPGRGARSKLGSAPNSNVIGIGPAVLPGSPGFPNSGSGGSGGCNGESSSGTTGGAGGSGVVYIYEFI